MKRIIRTLLLLSTICFTGTVFAQKSIKFTEEENIIIDQDYTKKVLKIEKLVILSGDYEIKFDENPNGAIYFRLSEDIEIDADTDGGAFGIRIAKKKARCSKHSCACSIGFNCGFTKMNFAGSSQTDDDRTVSAKLSINAKTKILKLEFNNPINWTSLE